MSRKIPLILASLFALSFGALGVRAADRPAEPAKAGSAKSAPAADKPADTAATKADEEKAKRKAKQKRHIHTRDHKQM